MRVIVVGPDDTVAEVTEKMQAVEAGGLTCEAEVARPAEQMVVLWAPDTPPRHRGECFAL